MLISIDPGINGCGVAYFVDAKLVKAVYVPNPAAKSDTMAERALAMACAVFPIIVGPSGDGLALELPQIYRFKGKGDPNKSLVPLILVDGALTTRFGAAATLYLPHQWKGSGDPDECILRIQDRLTGEERSRVKGPPGLIHNVWDAAGIGLYHLGRFNRRRVYARS